MLLTKLSPASRVVNIRGNTSRAKAARILKDAGHLTYPITVYENKEPEIAYIPAPIDIVIFASPTAAQRFLKVNPHAKDAWTIAIGPTTATWLQNRGVAAFMSHSTENDDLLHAVKTGLKR